MYLNVSAVLKKKKIKRFYILPNRDGFSELTVMHYNGLYKMFVANLVEFIDKFPLQRCTQTYILTFSTIF